MTLFLIFPLLLSIFIYFNHEYLSSLLNIFDEPGLPRKLHLKKTSLIGGSYFFICFILSFLTCYIFANDDLNFLNTTKEIFSLFFSLIVVFFIGLFDDKYDLSANKKLTLMLVILITTILINTNLAIDSLKLSFLKEEYILNKNLSVLFTAFCIMLFINAFNMIDGVNGNSILYSINIFLIFLLKDINFILTLMILINLIFLLLMNLTNKLFLGDSGTLSISLIISFFFINSYNRGHIQNVETIFTIMLIPGIELLSLTIFRLMNGLHPFKADRNHLHHYLLKRFNKSKIFIITNIIYMTPFLLSLVFKNKLYPILLSITLYFLLISYLHNLKDIKGTLHH